MHERVLLLVHPSLWGQGDGTGVVGFTRGVTSLFLDNLADSKLSFPISHLRMVGQPRGFHRMSASKHSTSGRIWPIREVLHVGIRVIIG